MPGKGAEGQREGNLVKGGIILAWLPSYASFLEIQHDTAVARSKLEINQGKNHNSRCALLCSLQNTPTYFILIGPPKISWEVGSAKIVTLFLEMGTPAGQG